MSYTAPGNPFAGRDANISYTVTNTGDIRLSPVATVAIGGAFGLGRRSLPERQIPELLPGSSVHISEIVHDVRPYARLTAELSVVSADDAVAVSSSLTQWAMPVVGLVVLAVAVIAVIGWRVVRRRRAGA